MQKQVAPKKKKMLKFLPKAASAVNFHSLPFSPGRDKRLENAHKHKINAAGKGLSGPIMSIIPVDVRRNTKDAGIFDQSEEEPTSPKVSCIGQIKHKKKMNKATNKRVSPPQETKPVSRPPRPQLKKHPSILKRLFGGAKQRRRFSPSNEDKPALPDRAPPLSQMKRFASGRDSALASFDWSMAPVATVQFDHRDYYSDEERGAGAGFDEEEEEEEEEFIIPFSAPIMISGGVDDLRPRNEVNLWKRRTMNPPRPLQMN